MKTRLIAQEILIVYSSTLFTRMSNDENSDQIHHPASHEIFQNTFRKNLLSEDVFENCTKLFLKEINETNSFLELEYDDFQNKSEQSLSINSYLLFKNKSEN